jgi:hypothetical protein
MFLLYYWPILFHDGNQLKRMKIYSKGSCMSTFADLCQHLAPEIGVFCEIFDVEVIGCKYQRCFLVLYGIIYLLFCIKMSGVKGIWPYSILEQKNALFQMGFYLAVLLLSIGIYELMVLLLKKKVVEEQRRHKNKEE